MANPFIVTNNNKNPFLLGEDQPSLAKEIDEGYLPAAVNIVGDIARSIPAGIAGFGGALRADVLKGEDPGLKGAEAYEQSMEHLRGATPRYRGPEVEAKERKIGEAIEKYAVEPARAVGRVMPGALLGGEVRKTVGLDPNVAYESGALAGEMAAELAPLPGAAMLGRAGRAAYGAVKRKLSGGEKLSPQDAAILKQAQDQAKAEGRPVAVVLEELATGKKEVVKEDLFEGEPIPVSPEARNPFILPPERIAELEAELNKPSPEQIAETVRYTEAITGQRDLVDPVMSATEARPSLRSKERGPDIAELPTERVPGRAAPKLTEQELYGPIEGRIEPLAAGIPFTKETPPSAPPHRTSVSDQSAINERRMNEAEIAWDKKVSDFNERARINELLKQGEEIRQAHAADYTSLNEAIDTKLRAFVQKGDFRGSLEYIRDSKDIPPYLTYLADILLRDKEFNPKLVFAESINDPGLVPPEGWTIGGMYQWKRGEGPVVTMSDFRGHAGRATTLLHEAVHAKVAFAQWAYERGGPLPRQAREAAETISGLYDYVKKHADPEFLKTHGMSDAREFMAEGFTNPEFQKVLKDMRYHPGPGEGFLKNVLTAWDAFVHSVARLLGIEPGKINVLSALLNEGAKLMRAVEADPALRKAAYGTEAIKQAALFRGSVLDTPEVNKRAPVEHKTNKQFLDELKAAGKDAQFIKRFGKFLYKDYLEQWNTQYGYPKPQVGYDNRPHEEFRKDLYNPDGQMRIDDIKHSFGPAYTESKRHPILNRVYDQTSQAENAINNLFDDLYRGQTIETGKGISAMRHAKLKESPDSVASISTKFNKKEIESFTEVVGDMLEKGRVAELMSTPEKFLGVNESRMVRAIKKLGDEGLAKINAARAKQGIEPIKGRDDWFTSFVRHGKYHIYSIGEDGKSTYRKGFNTAAEANTLAAHLRGEGFKNIRVSTAANDPRRVMLPPEAFYQARKMAETKEARDALSKAIEEASLRMGTKKYGMARDSEAGGLPLSKQEITALGHQATFDNFMFGVRAYANSVARYAGGNEYATRVYAMLGDHQGMVMDYPNATNAARARWLTFQGLDKSLADFSRLVAGANQAFLQTAIVSLNPVFYSANVLQFGFTAPRMLLENARTLGGKGNVPAAILRGISDVYIDRTPEMRDIIRVAVDNGSLEPRFAEALDWNIAEGTKWGNAARALTLQKVAALSDSFSRMASYMMFYRLGEFAGLKGKQAHSFAAKETQGIMIQYSPWARMPMFNQLGALGDLMSPVTSFISNLGFNVGQYIKTAAVGDKVAGRLLKPLLAYLTAQTVLSGTKGLPGYEDLDQMVGWLNQMYVEKFGGEWFGTPSEVMSELGMNDYVQYGVPSAATGINMTPTLGFGHVVPQFVYEMVGVAGGEGGQVAKAFPGVDFGTKAVESVFKLASNSALPNLTDAERERLFSQITPGAAKEWVKQAFSAEGMNLTKGRMVGSNKDAIYQRSPMENIKSLISGKPSIPESKVKAAVRLLTLQEQSVGKAKTTAIQMLVDAIINERDIPAYTERVISNYPGVLEGLMESTIKELESRQVPFYERRLMEAVQSSGLSAARKMQTLEQLFGGINQ